MGELATIGRIIRPSTKTRRRRKRGAPAEYSEEARQKREEARQERMAEARRNALHSLARDALNGPRRAELFVEVWQYIKHCNDLLDWQACGWIAEALDDIYPNEVVYVVLDRFATVGLLKVRTTNRTGTREYRLAPKQAAEARRYIDLTGEYGLGILDAMDEACS